MKLTGYRFGRIEVDGEEWTRDVMVLPSGAQPWIRKEGHRVHPEDLQAALAENPELIIVGTGYSGVLQVTSEAENLVKERGIELLVLKTGEAVEAYSELSHTRRACALLHLTC
ncbi:MTH938/NDUFAF3 family protein [Candidatus Bipolaricaulota bacterium]|nr:MTH938/NDUFAF3 family protein [Candidatus Bipolaricaulota bacterium]